MLWCSSTATSAIAFFKPELSILIVIFATACGSPLPLFLLRGVATYVATFLICSESSIIVIEKQNLYNTQKYLSI